MNRRGFLRTLGIGAASAGALAVSKTLITPEDEEFGRIARRFWSGWSTSASHQVHLSQPIRDTMTWWLETIDGPVGPFRCGDSVRLDRVRLELTRGSDGVIQRVTMLPAT